MRFAAALSPLLVAAALLAGGCQRLEEADDDAFPDTDFGFDDSSSGDTFLESSASQTEGDQDPNVVGCDPLTAAQCAPGQKCTAVVSGGTTLFSCVEQSGSLQEGEDCMVSLEDGQDGCIAGTVCLGDEAGTCRQLCDNDAQCETGQCLDDPLHGIPHCARDCDAFEPACPSLQQCRRQGDRFSCMDALPGDVGGVGEPCLLQGDAGCGQGLLCVTGALVPGCASGGCCAQLCDLGLADPCSSPATCNAALETAAPGYESVGACFVPA
jgi:hypothetical protein